ncbi:5-formyltetrahydrofolate cyclo-ligase [Melghirimyces profundicolus]|nr:5-formyltetrahydrofolate cyclo-ligase [Melghirimyces profundicolus]
MGTEKDVLRVRLLEKRRGLDSVEAEKQSAGVCGVLGTEPRYREAGTVLFYMPHRGEVDVRPLMERSWREGKRVVLPRSVPRTRSLELYTIRSLDDLIRGAYGITEPRPSEARWIDPAEVEWAVVPGVGFDTNGYRLGYGAGYYDRFFAGPGTHVIRVGAAYTFQLVPTVHPEPHDQPMHAVATPGGILRPDRGEK